MFAILFLLFLCLPILELALLLRVGASIGAWPTLGIVILTAFTGSWLVKKQGIALIGRIQEQTRRGELPAAALVDGLFLLVAGLFLMTPGFITDALGLLLLSPAFRRWVVRYAQENMKSRIVTQVSFTHVGADGSVWQQVTRSERPYSESNSNSDFEGQGAPIVTRIATSAPEAPSQRAPREIIVEARQPTDSVDPGPTDSA